MTIYWITEDGVGGPTLHQASWKKGMDAIQPGINDTEQNAWDYFNWKRVKLAVAKNGN